MEQLNCSWNGRPPLTYGDSFFLCLVISICVLKEKGSIGHIDGLWILTDACRKMELLAGFVHINQFHFLVVLARKALVECTSVFDWNWWELFQRICKSFVQITLGDEVRSKNGRNAEMIPSFFILLNKFCSQMGAQRIARTLSSKDIEANENKVQVGENFIQKE